MKNLLRGLKPYIGHLIAITLIAIFQVFCDLKLPDLMSNIVNTGIAQGDNGYIRHTGLLMIGFAAMSLIAAVSIAFIASHVAMGYGRDMRRKIFTHVEDFALDEFEGFGTSSLITRTTNDVQQVQQFFQMLLTIAVTAPFTFLGAAFMAYRKDSVLSIIIFVTIPILVAIIVCVFRFSMPLLRTLQGKIDNINRVTREGLTGIRVIRAYDKQTFEEERFEYANGDFAKTFTRINRIMGLMMPLIMIVVNLAALTIIWVGSHQVDIGRTNVGNMMAIMQYSMQTLFSVMLFSIVFTLLPRAYASSERVAEVLDTNISISDPEHPVSISAGQRGHLEFSGVTFSHEGAENPTLRDIEFTLKPGETTAIIGSTGSGKSSLVNLILRFYDPTVGRIFLDGVDIAKLTQHDLRSRIGYVPQKAFLFEGTIAENIRYGNEAASLEEVKHAAWVAQADDFIQSEPGGYDFMVSQGGSNLSGGQKQRLAIARALVRKPEVYIFDDSFSALDYKTDAKLRAQLLKEVGDATTLIVAQRVSSVMTADQIIVMDNGNISDIGTHEELLEQSEVYKEIVESQMTGEEAQRNVG